MNPVLFRDGPYRVGGPPMRGLPASPGDTLMIRVNGGQTTYFVCGGTKLGVPDGWVEVESEEAMRTRSRALIRDLCANAGHPDNGTGHRCHCGDPGGEA